MSMKPQCVVQRQLDAYNAKDLDAFLACYADDIRLYRPPEVEPLIEGKAALSAFYAAHRFNRPRLSAALVSRMVVGRKVIDHELVDGLGAANDPPVHAALVFEVDAELIRAVWVFNGQ